MFDILVPAGTVKASAIETNTNFQQGDLVGVEVTIPDGPSGNVGFRIAFAHQPVIPRTQDAWIIGNDEKVDWPLIGYGDSGAWSVFAYNTDLFDHTLHVRFLISDIHATDGGPAVAPIFVPPLS